LIKDGNGGSTVMEMLSAKNVNYVYQTKYQKVQALEDVSCSFEAGKFYAIIGHSGSGKTTPLFVLAGLGTPAKWIRLCRENAP